MVQSAWGPSEPQPEVKGPEPGSYLKVPIVAVMDEAAMSALFEQLRTVARDGIAAGLADAIGTLQPPQVNMVLVPAGEEMGPQICEALADRTLIDDSAGQPVQPPGDARVL